jgi:hypothetical protein
MLVPVELQQESGLIEEIFYLTSGGRSFLESGDLRKDKALTRHHNMQWIIIHNAEQVLTFRDAEKRHVSLMICPKSDEEVPAMVTRESPPGSISHISRDI